METSSTYAFGRYCVLSYHFGLGGMISFVDGCDQQQSAADAIDVWVPRPGPCGRGASLVAFILRPGK